MSDSVKSSGRGGRPRSSAHPASPNRDGPGQFREGLESLEALLDEALRESGDRRGASLEEGPLIAAAEGLLSSYARLRRRVSGPGAAGAQSALSAGGSADPDGDTAFEQALSPLLRFLYERWWRVDLQGLEHVPGDGPVVLVANSAGGLLGYDGAMLRFGFRETLGTDRPVNLLLDDVLMDLPVTGDLLARCGAVRASEDNGDALLARGAAVACFPEGRAALGRAFYDRYHLDPFPEAWFVRMALRAGAPVLPVAIVGAEEIHPVLARWDWLARRIGLPYVPVTPTFPFLGVGGLIPLPSRWRIEVGRAIELPRGAGGAPWDDSRLVRRGARIVRERLKALLDATVARRGSAFCPRPDPGQD